MTTMLLLSGLLIAQVGPFVPGNAATTQTDVAYEQLANGEVQAVITRLEAARNGNPDDPALLINLGSAYAQAGQREKAASLYREAIGSSVRYRLELADGSWVDSRQAARSALAMLEQNALAARTSD